MRYRFVARSSDGGNKTGFLEASDEGDARRQLERRKLELVKLEIDAVEQPVFLKPVSPPPAAVEMPKKPIPPSLWSQLDRGRLARSLLLLMLILCLGGWVASRAMGEKTYVLHLSGHLALVSKQDLGNDYMDRVQLGLRLTEPAWQINRDGSIEVKGEDGRYHRGQQRAKVQFHMSEEGDYQMDVEIALAKRPDQVNFFVEAPGFPPKQRIAKLTPGAQSNLLESKVTPMAIKRLKKRETRATAQVSEPTPSAALPKFDAEAPEPEE